MTIKTCVHISMYIFIYSYYKYRKHGISPTFQVCVFLTPRTMALETFSSFPSFLCNKHPCDLSGGFSNPCVLSFSELGRSLTGPRCLPPSPSAVSAVGVLPVTKVALLQGGPCLPSHCFLASPFSWEACTSYSSKAHMFGNLIPSQPGVCGLNRVLGPDWVFQK